MAEIRKEFVSIIMFFILASALLTFVIVSQSSNGVSSGSLINESGAFDGLNSVLNISDSNNPYSSLNVSGEINSTMQSTQEISFGWVIWNGVVSFGQIIIKLPLTIFNLLGTVACTILFIPLEYANMVATAVTVSLLILLYRFWRQGN